MKKSIYYRIAQHQFAIESAKSVSFQKHFNCGIPFMNEQNATSELLFTMCLDIPLPDWKKNKYSEWGVTDLCRFEYESNECVFSRYKMGYLFRMDFFNGKEPLLMLKEDQNQNFMTNFSMQQHIDIIDFKFALWMAYGMMTTAFQTVPIHASSIVFRRQAILFLGESEAGKSTQSKLWVKHIQGSTLLNDDSPIVRIIDGNILAFGSIWSGKTPCYRNEQYPVAAFVRIRQAKKNGIKKLNILEALAAIYPSCPPMLGYDNKFSDYIHTILSAIIAQVPVYLLDCLPDEESSQLTCSTIFNKDRC